MDPSDIIPFDLHRMFLGDVPLLFLLEIAVRTAIMYLYTIGLVRTMGSRTLGQLSMVEFLLVVAIGSAVGDPMLYADVPLIHGIVVITVVVGINRLIVEITNRNEMAENVFDGKPRCLVRDGLMQVESLESANLNREKLFLMLRLEKVRHLGEVEYAFLEQGGNLSLYERDPADVMPGLNVTPPWDLEAPNCWQVGDVAPQNVPLGCDRCGFVEPTRILERLEACPSCGGETWADAVTMPDAVAQSDEEGADEG